MTAGAMVILSKVLMVDNLLDSLNARRQTHTWYRGWELLAAGCQLAAEGIRYGGRSVRPATP